MTTIKGAETAGDTGKKEEDLFRTWLPAGVSLQTADADGDTTPEAVWRVDYPDDNRQARQLLDTADDQLRHSLAAAELAPARLDAYVAYAAGTGALPSSTVAPGLSRPEARLTQTLTVAVAPQAATSFAGAGLVADSMNAIDTLRSLADRLRTIVADFVRVESYVEDELIAFSRLTWGSDIKTWMAPRLSRGRMRLHQRSFALALGSRQTIVRLATMVVVGTGKLLALLAVPGGFLRVAPLVMRFAEEIKAEYEQSIRVRKEIRHG